MELFNPSCPNPASTKVTSEKEHRGKKSKPAYHQLAFSFCEKYLGKTKKENRAAVRFVFKVPFCFLYVSIIL